jgi:hypothetical protein
MSIFQGDLLTTIETLNTSLNEAITAFYKAGVELAETESDYSITLRQKALIEKDSGVSVTFIDKFLRGDTEVAEKRKKRDIAEAKRDTLKEKINSLKLQIRVVEAQAEREWSARSSDY